MPGWGAAGEPRPPVQHMGFPCAVPGWEQCLRHEPNPSASPSPGPPSWAAPGGDGAGRGIAGSRGRAVPAAAGVPMRGTADAVVPAQPRCPLLPGTPVASPRRRLERGPLSAEGTGSSSAPPGAAGATGGTGSDFPAARPPSGLHAPVSLSACLPRTAHRRTGLAFSRAVPPSGQGRAPALPRALPRQHRPVAGAISFWLLFHVPIQRSWRRERSEPHRGKVTPVTDYFLNPARAGPRPSRFPPGGRAVCWRRWGEAEGTQINQVMDGLVARLEGVEPPPRGASPAAAARRGW